MLKIFLLFSIFLTTVMQGQELNKVESVVKFQNKINKDFRGIEHSPLPAKEKKAFKGLEFFPIDTNFSVTAELVRTPFEIPFRMATSSEREATYLKFGELHFEIGGKQYKLNVYQSHELKKQSEYKDYLFLPFTDLTNGTNSYSGGRYLDLKIPKTHKIQLDFNKAYNPYCAYNGKYSCPIPPKENHLDLAVTAGVKAYQHK